MATMTIRNVTVAGRIAGAAVALGLLAASCSAQPAPGASGASRAAGHKLASGGVLTLNRMSTLRALFNRADGHVRLVLIFSPT
jgi:hypothetical protein